MVKTNFPLCLFTNGEIIVDGESVSYRNGYECFIMVDSDISYNNLFDLICKELEVDRTKFNVEIKLKFPSYRGYRIINLNNDKNLKVMWATICQSNINAMDLYIELIPIEVPLEIRNPEILETNDVEMLVSITQVNDIDQTRYNDDSDNDDNDEYDNGRNDDEVLNNFDVDDDIVSPSARNPEFCKLYEYEGNDDDVIVISHKNDGEFYVNQVFKSKEKLTKAVRLYHIEKSQTFKFRESKLYTVTYVCNRKPNPCSWYLRASTQDGLNTFTIVTYKGPHRSTCRGDTLLHDHPNLNTAIICNSIKPLVAAHWGLQVSIIQAHVNTQFKFSINYMKAWSAKQRAIAELFGDWDKSYELLPRYLDALKKANPGTQVHFSNQTLEFDSNVEQFDRVFWAFGPSIRGFQHCRPVITIDGTHLYGKYKGVLLIALGVDGNEQIYPLAFALVEKESISTWKWFLACVRHYVTQRQGICVISDRHVGVMQAMNEVGSGWEEPHAYHRYCVRHFATNINQRFKSRKVKKEFMSTAYAHQIKKWDMGMKVIGTLDPAAKIVLERVDKTKWSTAHDGGYRYGIRTTNLVECFNGVLKNVRFLPVTAIVEATFFRLNAYMVTRRELAKNRVLSGNIRTPHCEEKIQLNENGSAQHRVDCFNKELGQYGVITAQTRAKHAIDLLKKTCTCNKWQIYHFPCTHVMAVCRKESIMVDAYVDHFYSSEEYLASYLPSFHPVPDEPYWMPWTGVKLIPNSDLKRGEGKGGRPKSSRFHNEMDNRSKGKCSLCHVEGHNKRRCPSKASGSGT